MTTPKHTYQRHSLRVSRARTMHHSERKRERKRNSTNENEPFEFSGTNAWINYQPQSMPNDHNNKIIVTSQLQTLCARTWSSNSSWPFHAARANRFGNVFRIRKTTPKAIRIRNENEKSRLWFFGYKKSCQRRHVSRKIQEKTSALRIFSQSIVLQECQNPAEWWVI